MDYRQESRYLETETAPVLETPGRAGSGIILELVTAGRSRHAELDSSHNARSRRKVQALDTSIAINFLRQPGAGGARSNRSEKGMSDTITFNTAYGKDRRALLDVAVWEKSGGFCWYCGCQVKLFSADPDDRMTIDHVVSQVDGGGGNLENLVPACKSCNSGKGRRSVEAFRWTLYRKAQGIPKFSPEQRDWLSACGFVFDGLASHRFWFELEGLS